MLTSKQKKCVELMISGDFTQREIAQQINITEATICNWKKNEEFIAEYESRLNKTIHLMAAKAFSTETSLLNAKSEMVRLLAAKDILDRAGFKAKDKTESINQPDGEIKINIISTKELKNN